jgi:hypothetical protein
MGLLYFTTGASDSNPKCLQINPQPKQDIEKLGWVFEPFSCLFEFESEWTVQFSVLMRKRKAPIADPMIKLFHGHRYRIHSCHREDIEQIFTTLYAN